VDEQAWQAEEILDDWDEWEGTVDGFMANNSARIETVYTRFRQATAHTQPHSTFAKLDDELNVNIALIPVRSTTPTVAKLARARFHDDRTASEWMRTCRARGPEEDEDTYVFAILEGTPYGTHEDQFANYERLKRILTTPQRAAPKGQKLNQIGEKMWSHIVNGEIKIDKVGKHKTPTAKVSGLHTIHGPQPVAEGYGPKKDLGLGCYRQAVRPRPGQAQGATEVDKKNESTFFPDTWDLEDIREAIEYASKRGNEYEVLTPEKGIGLTLFFNGESYYPNFR
jgi:hypothetical protein